MGKRFFLYGGLLISFATAACNSNCSIIDDDKDYVTNGLDVQKNSDERGNVRTGLKCLKTQALLSKFEFYVGHSNDFSDLIGADYFSRHNNACFGVIETIYDNAGIVVSQKIISTIEDFADDNYSYYIADSGENSICMFSYSMDIEIDFSYVSIDSGMIGFVFSLVLDNSILNDFDISYGLDNFAYTYFAKSNGYIKFSLNKGAF